MERDARLLAGIAILSFAAASADAAPAPLRFELTIVATAHQEWDHTGTPGRAGGCERIVRAEGLRDVRFKTSTPSVVRFVRGRLLMTTLRNLTGTATVVGSNNISETCGGKHTEAIADCVRTRQAFHGGRLGLRGTRAGSITLGAPRTALRRTDCPRQPADVRRAPLGPVPGPLRVSTVSLENERIARITLTASATRRKRYGPVEQGTLEQRSAWRLTLVRLPS